MIIQHISFSSQYHIISYHIIISFSSQYHIISLSHSHLNIISYHYIIITYSNLRTASCEYEQFKSEYNTVQQSLVEKIVEVALTYIPLFNIFSSLIAQLDVLVSFAEISSSAVIPYTRPVFLDVRKENCMWEWMNEWINNE